jgi:hypothetical protein
MDALRTWTIRLSEFEKVKHVTWDRRLSILLTGTSMQDLHSSFNR